MLRKQLPFAATLFAAMTIASHASASTPADLITAYPEQLSRIENNELVWKDGTRMPISDGNDHKDFNDQLDHPSIRDMFFIPYRPGPLPAAPKADADPGRIRYEPLFLKMYGDCDKGEVQAHLRKVPWPTPQGMGFVLFTTINHAADQLEAVSAELRKLPVAYTRYFTPDNGTFVCRTIAGTHRRSMHAYGAAIDINRAFGDYWRNEKDASHLHYRNRIPYEIVDIFEKHGFIWGGKWYHYDTLHFEYRPELLPPFPAKR